MALFRGYIARFIAKKRIINGNPWHEHNDPLFRDTSSISPADAIKGGISLGVFKGAGQMASVAL